MSVVDSISTARFATESYIYMYVVNILTCGFLAMAKTFDERCR